ncbi:MAG: SDR family oxidoreductase [SAR202 cluster bacterium]|jgi:NAD(P)-dependent dehydrogenase (short-subunit alcohol dehydrogenase family)|nr:SDR family oxidoreductase [SAR202 cluster bacterium]|tara:strand:+ start:425 stop:628 length:204 start_codon:yes stop_codon:yes gene_type:complete
MTERWQYNIADKPELKKLMSETMPMGRPGSVEEVVDAVLWLLSESSSYVTGQTLSVDGAHSDSIAGY